MNYENRKRPSEADAELQREIRSDRKFSLEEAIARMAGPGMMKGVSPVPHKQQAEAAIEDYLNRHLSGAAGVLPGLVLRNVKESELLLANLERPFVALAACVQRILDSEHLLKEFVREADVEWGRAYGERPYFEQVGCPPSPEDPYTIESVRTALSQLLEKLAADDR